MKRSAATNNSRDRRRASSRRVSQPGRCPAPLRDELTRRLKAKLLESGWTPCSGDSAAELACFEYLLPLPDATFTLRNPATAEHCVVALHFAESESAVWYACTMRLPGGQSAQEHGLLDVVSGVMRLVETRGDMTCRKQG